MTTPSEPQLTEEQWREVATLIESGAASTAMELLIAVGISDEPTHAAELLATLSDLERRAQVFVAIAAYFHSLAEYVAETENISREELVRAQHDQLVGAYLEGIGRYTA